ncbi:sperm-associated antigen 4 protein isoform X3 [Pipistrellus kuhlii]|uniref:sperm-associated antigen 4 protein isoform X3 n=1 Tax=Pipistrellus kuhlii TaxID=59472 RepID=UPI001E270DB6|nr:sperm-associated antigen 4 protein isoform X3 [Pipistrellus kuhlii]
MRRGPRPGSAASPHKQAPNFYSDNSNSSVSTTSGDSSGHRSAGPGPGEPEGRRAQGSSCGEPALSPGLPGGAPRSHSAPTAEGAATLRGGASEPAGSPVVSEEQFHLLAALDLRQEMQPPRVFKSFLSPLFQVLSVCVSPLGDVLVSVYREVCSIRFLLTAVSLLSLFLTGEGANSPGVPALDALEPNLSAFSLTSLCPLSPSQSPAEPGSPPSDSNPSASSSLSFMQRNPLPLPSPETTPLFLQHSGGVSCTWSLLWRVEPTTLCPPPACSEYHERVRTQGQQLRQLQAELDRLHQEVSSVRAANSERVAKLVFQRLNEDFVRKPDYALSSVGASIDLEKTSRDYEDQNGAYFWNRFSFWNYARPPMVILEGLQVDDETEVFLGKFTFDMEKSEIQTFRLQNDPPTAFPKVKIQILSNWGHPHFTCLYRVRAHGMRTSEEAGDSATGGPN